MALDIFHLAEDPLATQIFRPNTPAAGSINEQFQVIQKPKGAKLAVILLVAGGGGGGGGFGNAAGNARAGGGGGGSSSMYIAMFPAFCLPDRMYIQVGGGGAGGAGSTGGAGAVAGSAGGATSLLLNPTNLSAGADLIQNLSGGGGGNVSTSTTATGGSAGTDNGGTITPNISIKGTGSSGDGFPPGINPSTLTITNRALSSKGAGAGLGGGSIKTDNTESIGNGWAAEGGLFTPLFNGIIPGGAIAGGNGNDGWGSLQPFVALGGTGGGANASGTGGKGGNGLYGSGGGGGGAGLTGGVGGTGGDGICVVVWI